MIRSVQVECMNLFSAERFKRCQEGFAKLGCCVIAWGQWVRLGINLGITEFELGEILQ